MFIEMHSVKAFEHHLATVGDLRNVVCQGLDLVHLSGALRSLPGRESAFLGCALDLDTQHHLIATGALVFPKLPGVPYRPYRPALYSIDELLTGYRRGHPGSFANDALDSEIYRHFQAHRSTSVPILEALAQRLHDHAIDNALADVLRDEKVVAIMGGHALLRGASHYRAIAEIGRSLTRAGFFVATGGGPGAMEAGNLGAWLAPFDDEALDDALLTLEGETSYQEDAFIDTALEIRDRYPEGADSLAIPTWFYGHEPTNPFARHIAKYFANSLREDGLLAIATHGVVYAPGSAGTIQEVFMDACQNHYGTFPLISPMVFFDRTFWTETRPVLPLLDALAADRVYAGLIGTADTPNEVLDFLLTHEPVAAKKNGGQT